MEANFSHIPVQSLLLQQPPVLSVDTFLSFTMERTLTRFTVKEGCFFVKDGCLSEPGLVENMAQTCAVRTGYIGLYIQKQETPAVGVIGQVKDLQIFSLPAVGSVLETEVLLKMDWGKLSLISARVLCGQQLIAQCEMTISLT